MKALLHFSTILLIFSLLPLTGCNSKKHPVGSGEEDTRILVRRAFDSADIMVVRGIKNVERAKLLGEKWEKEKDPTKKLNLSFEYANELLKSGKAEESSQLYSRMLDIIDQNKFQLDSASRRNLLASAAIAYMRLGETQNCVQNHNHQSCFIPIKGEGVHQLPDGSRKAISIYESLLREFPNDLESQYLLNIAYMTLGEYPSKVPAAYRFDPSWYTSKVKIQPFREIAASLGINRLSGAGGCVMDDFTNDGWPDIVTCSWSPKDPVIFYVNNGDGSFSDQTAAYGLTGFLSGLNLNQVDFNNDGWMDIFIMRGAWLATEGDIPPTLLMNTGKGKFVDVTIRAGIIKFGATQTSAWTDIDLDGWLDLVIGHESMPPDYNRGIDVYINQKDGTFSYKSFEYGLTQNLFIKGCVATDANNDKYPDIYISCMGQGTFLYLNKENANGQRVFELAGPSSNIGQPKFSFPSWSFDYDNDGNEDLFTSAYTNDGTPSYHWVTSHLGKPDPQYLPKLYHNKGNAIYEEVGVPMGLTEIAYTMGCNFGDINTDGFLDFYLSTGNPQYQSIVPNKMYLNMEGKKFEDVSYSGGFANIQKGHSVAFGDPDHDGDEDIYVVIGGAFDGDKFYNCFFENPNENNNNWLVLKLEGKTANRAAIGARVIISVTEGGEERKIYRLISSGASFGANTLSLEVGLRKATAINTVTVQWPCKDCPDQVFTGFDINKAYVLHQDQSSPVSMEYTKVAFKEHMDHEHMDHMEHMGK